MYDPEVLKSSLGTFFGIKIWESKSPEIIAWLKRNSIKILATTPYGDTNYTQTNLNQSLAIILGAEYTGLSKTWLDEADIKIKIPMFGQANSMNVTAVEAILLYEMLRQQKSI